MLTLLVLAATVGAELDPTNLVVRPAANSQRATATAWDGAQWLTVWEDHRPDGFLAGVWAARVPAAGTASSFPITNEAATSPAVSCTASACLVVWSLGSMGVRAARLVGPTVLDTTSLVIDSSASGPPAVACGGTRCLVVSTPLPTGGVVRGVRVDFATGVVDSTPLTLVPTGVDPVVSFDGTDFVVAWSSGGDVSTTRVSPTGVVGATHALATTTAAEGYPQIACVTGQCLVSWEVGAGPTSLMVRRVGPGGPVDASPVQVGTIPAGTLSGAGLTVHGSNYGVAWISSSLFALSQGLVTSAGMLALTVPSTIVSSGAFEPSLASDGTDLFVAWADTRGADFDIYGRRLLTDGSGVLLSTGGNRQLAPSLSATGTGFLASWQDERTGAWDIVGARLDSKGVSMDLPGLAISTATNAQEAPAVACQAGCFVLWADRRSSSFGEARSSRISNAGTVLDPTGALALSTSLVDRLAVAGGGGRYLALWNSGMQFAAMPFDATSGAPLLGTPTNLGLSDSFLTGGVAFGSGVFLAVASRYNGLFDEIVSVRVSTAGVALDATPVLIGDGNAGHGGTVSRQPVASDGTGFMAAWDNGGAAEVRLISAQGQPAGAPLVLGTGALPAITFDGVDYVVGRKVGTGLRVVRVGTDGGLRAPEVAVPFAFVDQVRDLTLASNSPGTVLLAYSRYDSTAAWGSRRVRTVFIEFDTDGGVVFDGGVIDGGADAGTTDSGVTDAGATDAGVTDAGATDAGVSDAGASDAGVSDAGASDAGAIDAGASDAGELDAGAGADGGAADGGDGADGGAQEAGHYVVGCGCDGAGAGSLLAGWAWLVWLVRRRQRSGFRSTSV